MKERQALFMKKEGALIGNAATGPNVKAHLHAPISRTTFLKGPWPFHAVCRTLATWNTARPSGAPASPRPFRLPPACSCLSPPSSCGRMDAHGHSCVRRAVWIFREGAAVVAEVKHSVHKSTQFMRRPPPWSPRYARGNFMPRGNIIYSIV